MQVNRRGNAPFTTVEDLVTRLSRTSKKDLLNPVLQDPRLVNGLYKAVLTAIDAIRRKAKITIIGDYDSDGLNASAILWKLFYFYRMDAKVIIPRRIQDGYGLSDGLLSQIEPGLVITIDNGIAAVNEIKTLKIKGCTVIVMDHHLPGEKLPEADVIVDPHVDHVQNAFVPYCGAGLGYQFARLMLDRVDEKEKGPLLREMLVHAAIATITDVVPMLGGNRRIVMDGLDVMNNRSQELTPGIRRLVEFAKKNGGPITEETIGYKIGPLINAPARMDDSGGEFVWRTLVSQNDAEALNAVEKMDCINNERKELVKSFYDEIKKDVEARRLARKGAPLTVYCPKAPEGLLGILAGKLVDDYGMPAFVFVDSDKMRGMVKGSGRSVPGCDLQGILKEVKPLCYACGGHSGAAGVTVPKNNLLAMVKTMKAGMKEVPVVEKTILYDVEIPANAVESIYKEVAAFAPYGEGVPKPVFLIHGINMAQKGGSSYRLLVADQQTLKFTDVQTSVSYVGFGLGSMFNQCGCPSQVDVIGTVGENWFNGRSSIQVQMEIFRQSPRLEGGYKK